MNIKSFYKVLEETLVGKRVRLRSYNGGERTNYTDYLHDEDDKIIGWNNEGNYVEWEGTVERILENDNSHVDIIFDDTQNIIFPKGYHKDCYNWHMGDMIEFVETEQI